GHRVEVGVADPLPVFPLVLHGASPMRPPAPAVAELPDLLHVHVDHVPGIPGDDLPWSPQVFTVWSDVSDPVQSQPVQPPRHRPHATTKAMAIGKLASDPTSGPL